MKISILAVVIFASCATFRRSGHGFTDKGTAFPDEHFDEKQLAAIQAEPRLSVKEMPIENIPDGVDTSLVDAAITAEAKAEEIEVAPETKPAPKSTKKTPGVIDGSVDTEENKA